MRRSPRCVCPAGFYRCATRERIPPEHPDVLLESSRRVMPGSHQRAIQCPAGAARKSTYRTSKSAGAVISKATIA
jgi:hypothetical protein